MKTMNITLPNDITPEQEASFWRVLKHQGEENFVSVYEDCLNGCLIVRFNHILIGIETDGHAHR